MVNDYERDAGRTLAQRENRRKLEALLRVFTAERTVRTQGLYESCEQIVLMRPN